MDIYGSNTWLLITICSALLEVTFSQDRDTHIVGVYLTSLAFHGFAHGEVALRARQLDKIRVDCASSKN